MCMCKATQFPFSFFSMVMNNKKTNRKRDVLSPILRVVTKSINGHRRTSPFPQDFAPCRREFLFGLPRLVHVRSESSCDRDSNGTDCRIPYRCIFPLESARMVPTLRCPTTPRRDRSFPFQRDESTSVLRRDLTVVGPSYMTTPGKRYLVRLCPCRTSQLSLSRIFGMIIPFGPMVVTMKALFQSGNNNSCNALTIVTSFGLT